MSDWEDLYPSPGSTTDRTGLFPNAVNSVDLRREFNNLVLGASGETPIGKSLILRRMRRDSNNNLIPCTCLSDLTKEPDRDFPCSYCYGRGYLWDEELITGYVVVSAAPGGSNAAVNSPKTEIGQYHVPSARFFLDYSISPTKEDRIVEIELDSNGDAVTPYNRIAIYELLLVRALRADNGRIEFWVCNGQKMGPNTLGMVG